MTRRTARVCALLLVLFVAVALIAPAVRADEDDPTEGVFEIVVKLRPSSRATIDDVNMTYGTRTIGPLLRSAGIYLISAPPGREVDELSETMAGDQRLLYAEPNYVQEAPESDRRRFHWGDGSAAVLGPDSAARDGQYAVGLLGLSQAHARTRGEGAVVAVVDTGFQLDHPVLADRLAPGAYDFVEDDPDPSDVPNAIDDDADGELDEGLGHATHVAGIALLAAPDARVLPLRVLNSDGTGNVFAAAEAILHAVAKGADVINLSFSTSAHSELLEDVIDDAAAVGVVVVAAAGNLATDVPPSPAGLDDVVAVTATDRSGLRAAFANFGSWIDVAAPGDDIVSAFPANGYAEWDGTSMAAPFVAGQAALLHADTGLRGLDVVGTITRTARPLDAGSGAGLVDVRASLGPHLACGQVLTESAVLTADLHDCPADGLVIGADGIMVDLGGHLVDGVGLGSGIRNDGHDGVAITGGRIEDFDYGVDLGPGTLLNQVTGLTVQRNQEAGIQLADAGDGTNGNQVRGNTVAGNTIGIALVDGTEHTVVEDNRVTKSGKAGVRLEFAGANRLTANTVDGSGEAGIAIVAASDRNRVDANTVSRSGASGIVLVDSTGTELIANTVRYSGATAVVLDRARDGLARGNDVRFNPSGFTLRASTGNRLEANDASQTTGTGIMLEPGSVANLVVANTANGNKARGLAIETEAGPGSANLIDGNTANGNAGGGVYLAKGGHVLRGNAAHFNSGWGIYAAPGMTDSGGNRASGNSERAQCFGVGCSA